MERIHQTAAAAGSGSHVSGLTMSKKCGGLGLDDGPLGLVVAEAAKVLDVGAIEREGDGVVGVHGC